MEVGWHPLQGLEWPCKENLGQLPQGWSDSLSRVPLVSSKFESRCTVQREEAQELHLRGPACQKILKRWGTLVVDIFVSKRTFKVPWYFSANLSDTKSSGDVLKVEWPLGLRYSFHTQT